MNRFSFLIAMLALIQAGTMSAQSLSTAKMYIEQGQYVNAAKQLQPLADGGNAEAQYLAAELFFDGHLKTAKVEEQGVKYATMSADQGYEKAVCLLALHYFQKDDKKLYSILMSYIDKFPEMKKGEPGKMLARCYMAGIGCMGSADLAWQTIEGNKYEKDFIEMYEEEYEAYKKQHPERFKDKEEDDRIYDQVEENAQFPGGDSALYSWLSRNIQFPVGCQKEGVQGRVIVSFVVNKDGSIVDEEIVRSPDKRLSQEALRVVRLMPKWKPAQLGNKTVRSRFRLPIMFRMN